MKPLRLILTLIVLSGTGALAMEHGVAHAAQYARSNSAVMYQVADPQQLPPCVKPTCTSVRFGPGTQAGAAAAASAGSYSCTLEVFSGKLNSTQFWAQGFLYCDQDMETVDEVLTAYQCSSFLGQDFCSEAYQMGPGCTYNNSQGTWCPLSGSYVSRSEPTGSSWRVYLDVNVYPYPGQGSSSSARAVGDLITL